jgi:hypothetical protein
VIAADGAPSAGAGGQSKVQDSRDSVDWAIKGGAAKYGTIDTTKIATAGHSCGGLEAMSTAYHDTRIKLMMLFDIAIFTDNKRYLLQELKAPVAWFVGGPKDMGFLNVRSHLMHRGKSDVPSLRKIIRCCQQGYLLIGRVLIRAIWEHTKPPMEGSLGRRLLRIFSGNSGVILHQRLSVKMQRHLAA